MKEDRNIHLVQFADGRMVTNERFFLHEYEKQGTGKPLEKSIKFQAGDVLFLLDPTWTMSDAFYPIVQELHRVGGRAFAVVHDLFPLRYPEFFNMKEPDAIFKQWHEFVMRECDGLICNSKATADTVSDYMMEHGIKPEKSTNLYYFPCGAVMPNASGKVRKKLCRFLADACPMFLMVGVINPRKDYATALEAFRKLWRNGDNAKLLIIGRHLINSEIEDEIMSVQSRDDRLLWLQDASDAELVYAYKLKLRTRKTSRMP